MKIKVEFLPSIDDLGIETAGILDMVAYHNGLINCGGRTLPF